MTTPRSKNHSQYGGTRARHEIAGRAPYVQFFSGGYRRPIPPRPFPRSAGSGRKAGDLVNIRLHRVTVLVSGAQFPVPGDYAGDPPPAEGLRQALAVATEAELRLTMTMLAMGAKLSAGLGEAERVTEPMEGTAALFGWLTAVVMDEVERRSCMFADLAGHGED